METMLSQEIKRPDWLKRAGWTLVLLLYGTPALLYLYYLIASTDGKCSAADGCAVPFIILALTGIVWIPVVVITMLFVLGLWIRRIYQKKERVTFRNIWSKPYPYLSVPLILLLLFAGLTYVFQGFWRIISEGYYTSFRLYPVPTILGMLVVFAVLGFMRWRLVRAGNIRGGRIVSLLLVLPIILLIVGSFSLKDSEKANIDRILLENQAEEELQSLKHAREFDIRLTILTFDRRGDVTKNRSWDVGDKVTVPWMINTNRVEEDSLLDIVLFNRNTGAQCVTASQPVRAKEAMFVVPMECPAGSPIASAPWPNAEINATGYFVILRSRDGKVYDVSESAVTITDDRSATGK